MSFQASEPPGASWPDLEIQSVNICMTAEWRKTNRTQKGAFLGRSLRQNLRTRVAAAVLWLPVAWTNCHLRGALGLETYSKVFEDNT